MILINGFILKETRICDKSVIRSYMKKWIRSANRMIPSTAANDNCQPASNNCVGLINKRTIAANDNVLTGLGYRRKKTDAQNTQQIIAALKVGALGGTTIRKTATAMAQINARAGFMNPIVLHNHQIIPNIIPRCMPERLIKCSRPVLRKAR